MNDRIRTSSFLRQTSFMKKNQFHLQWIFFLLPALIVYIVFLAMPLLSSLKLSLYEGIYYANQQFVGLKNYITLFTEKYYFEKLTNALGNTLTLLLVHVVFSIILGLILAVMLSRVKRGEKIYRTIIFLPTTLSVLVVGFLWRLILNPQWGGVPYLLNLIGLSSMVKPWLGDPAYAMIAVSLISSWQWVGMPTMLFLSALHSLDPEIMDAAMVDGASVWKVFWLIKLPLIMPVIGVYLIITFIRDFSAFDIVYSLESSRGDPLGATDIMGTFFYRIGIGGEPFTGIILPGLGAAIATVIFAILIIGVLLWLRLRANQYSE